MPKDTFLNLPYKKQDRIIDIAINEFIKYSYHKVSITRIVNKAEIAKGSFYQYFKNKKDLYKYIIQLVMEKKSEYLIDDINSMRHMSFFESIKKIYISGIKFTTENPRLSTIEDKFIKLEDEGFKKEIYEEDEFNLNTTFEKLLEEGIENNELKKDVNIKLVAVMLTSLSVSIEEYFNNELSKNDNREITTLVDDMVSVFREGIEKRLIVKPSKSVEDRFY